MRANDTHGRSAEEVRRVLAAAMDLIRHGGTDAAVGRERLAALADQGVWKILHYSTWQDCLEDLILRHLDASAPVAKRVAAVVVLRNEGLSYPQIGRRLNTGAGIVVRDADRARALYLLESDNPRDDRPNGVVAAAAVSAPPADKPERGRISHLTPASVADPPVKKTAASADSQPPSKRPKPETPFPTTWKHAQIDLNRRIRNYPKLIEHRRFRLHAPLMAQLYLNDITHAIDVLTRVEKALLDAQERAGNTASLRTEAYPLEDDE